MSARAARAARAGGCALALAGLFAAGGCIVRPDVYGEAYFCDGPAADTCADGWACNYSTTVDFCAPLCGAGGGGGGAVCDAGEICGDQGTCLRECANAGECPAGLECLVTQTSGYCATAYTCANDVDCVEALPNTTMETVCGSNVVERGNTCLFVCDTDATDCPGGDGCCPADHACTGSLLFYVTFDFRPRGLCTVGCTPTGGCPVTETCITSALLGADGQCLPGLAGFECESEANCLLGVCETVGNDAGQICTAECSTDADCATLDVDAFGFTGYVCDHTGGDPGHCAYTGQVCDDHLCESVDLEVCAQAFSAAVPADCLQACIPVFAPCTEAGLDCATPPAAATGLCLPPCVGPSTCPLGWGCVPNDPLNWGGLANHCIYGVPGVGCTSAANCLSGGECIDVDPGPGMAMRCMFPCATDADCAPFDPPAAPGFWSCNQPMAAPQYCGITS